jgi:uncharacterized protein (TIRG00374 family)
VGLSALSLYLAFRNVNFHDVWQAISRSDLRWVGLALLSVLINILLKAVRWRALLGEPGRKLALFPVLQALLAGQMLNILYPVRLGDLTRAYWIGGLIPPGRVFALGTIVLEKLLDTLSYAALFFLLIVFVPLPGWLNDSVYSLSLAILVMLAAVFILAYRPQWVSGLAGRVLARFPERVGAYLLARFRSAMESLHVLQDRAGLLNLALLSALIWGTAILNNALVLRALQIRLPWTAPLLVLMVLQAGISIAAVPGWVGIFEYSCILALAVFGVPQAPALSFGILLHLLVFLPPVVLGLVAFWLLGLSGRRPPAPASFPEPLDLQEPSGSKLE